MRNKFIVKDLTTDSITEYKNLKCIANAYPTIEYHQIYQIYLQSMGKTKRKQQPNNDIYKLFQTLKIFDNELDFKQSSGRDVVVVL